MVSTPYCGDKFVSASDSESYTSNSIVIGMASCWTGERVHIGQHEIPCTYRDSEVATPALDNICNTITWPRDRIT